MYKPGKFSNVDLNLKDHAVEICSNCGSHYTALRSWSRLTPKREYSWVDRNGNDCRKLTAQCRLEETNVCEEACTVCSTYYDRWLNTTLAFKTHTPQDIPRQRTHDFLKSAQFATRTYGASYTLRYRTVERSSVGCHACAVFSCFYHVGLCSPRQFNLQNYFEPDSCSGEGINLPLVRVRRSHLRSKL